MIAIFTLAKDLQQLAMLCRRRYGAPTDLVFRSIAEQTTYNPELCVLRHAVVVVYDGEEDKGMHNNLVLGSWCDGHGVEDREGGGGGVEGR